MKILWTSKNWNSYTPTLLKGHDLIIPKEDIEDVHEFSRENLLENLPADVLVVNDFKFKIDKEIVDKVGVIFTRTTGTDHIDMAYAKEKGVEVVNLKGEELSGVTAVPELCIGKMIELLRMGTPGYELKGKKLGLIGGGGRIGTILEKMASCLGMQVESLEKKDLWNKSYIGSVLSSDIVSLHISSTEENRNWMNLERFKLMKDGAFFLNSARNWLVDEEAFKWALDNKLNGAWVDFPMPFTRDNLLTTNHIGGNTFESAKKTEAILVNKLLQWKQILRH